MVLGAIPFGVLHLLNFTSGTPIYWDYIVGTSIAGIFLTSVFFSYGLFGAIAAHYWWNVFASISAKLSTFDQKNLEAGCWTYTVLLIFSAILLHRLSKERTKTKSSSSI